MGHENLPPPLMSFARGTAVIIELANTTPHVHPIHLHGHSFKVEIVVAGECDAKLGWLMDYADITAAFKPVWEKLDHNYLNKIPGLENPTSEIVAMWIWRKLKPKQ